MKCQKCGKSLLDCPEYKDGTPGCRPYKVLLPPPRYDALYWEFVRKLNEDA